MLPARERANTSHALDIHHVIQTRTPRIAKHSALNVRGLELPPLHENLPRGRDSALCDVEAVVLVFGEAQDHCDVRCAGGGADFGDFGGVVGEGVFNVGCR